MKLLPLLEFETAVARLKYWISPYLDGDTLAKSLAAIDAFAADEGPHLYRRLQEKAAAADGDWLTGLWRRQFLQETDSLPLAGCSMTMKVDWHAPQHGLKRISHFVITMAHLHRDYERGPQQVEKALNSTEANMEQFAVLRGAARKPQAEGDEIFYCNADEAGERYIVVMYRGYAWKVTLQDEKGGIATPAQLENVLYELVQHTAASAEIPFAAPSVLPKAQALEVRAQLLCRDENNRIMQTVNRAWFVLSLDSTHYNDDSEAFFDAAFGQGSGFWAYKPINYVYHIKDDRIFMHFDRAVFDPAAAKELLDLAQRRFNEGPFPRKNQLPDNLAITPINWTIDGRKITPNEECSRIDEMDGTVKVIYDALSDYQRRTEQMMVTVYDVFMTDDEQHLLRHYSDAAVIQILLQYAQLEVFGEVKNTCEILDMRQYRGGRTDVIASVTPDSLAFVRSLAHNGNDVALFQEAVAAHDKRLKLTQNGGGMYSFWQAMRYQSEHEGSELTLFRDAGLQSLAAPFVVTIESGAPRGAGHIVFTPPEANGFAVSYAGGRNYFNFVFTHKRSKVVEAEKITRAIGSGLKQILLMLREEN